MLLWRELGRSKIDGYRVISEAMSAEKVSMSGDREADHEVRLKAADRFLTLNGESVNPAGARMNIQLNGGESKILIQTADGAPVPFPMRAEE